MHLWICVCVCACVGKSRCQVTMSEEERDGVECYQAMTVSCAHVYAHHTKVRIRKPVQEDNLQHNSQPTHTNCAFRYGRKATQNPSETLSLSLSLCLCLSVCLCLSLTLTPTSTQPQAHAQAHEQAQTQEHTHAPLTLADDARDVHSREELPEVFHQL